MPNGGVPLNMVLKPQEGAQVVLYCRGAELQIIAREAWDQDESGVIPLAKLNAKETQVLT